MSCLGDKAGEVSVLPLDNSQSLFPLVVLLSVSLPACLYLCLSVCLPFSPSAFLSVALIRPAVSCLNGDTSWLK